MRPEPALAQIEDHHLPVAGVDLTLLARNNEILGTAKTDAEGRASFNPGLMARAA